MASPAASAAAAEFTQETARQSLIAISQSLPEAGSLRNSNVKPLSTPVANGYQDAGAANCRSKLMSISDLSSPDALPTPCPPKNIATNCMMADA
jgi:2-methylcitrate dehydratase PrpD